MNMQRPSASGPCFCTPPGRLKSQMPLRPSGVYPATCCATDYSRAHTCRDVRTIVVNVRGAVASSAPYLLPCFLGAMMPSLCTKCLPRRGLLTTKALERLQDPAAFILVGGSPRLSNHVRPCMACAGESAPPLVRNRQPHIEVRLLLYITFALMVEQVPAALTAYTTLLYTTLHIMTE